MEKPEVPTGLDWVKLREEIDQTYDDKRKTVWQKFKENPLVPLGALLTVAALSSGIKKFYEGDSKGQQRMMRWRIIAQFSTVAAAVAGGYLLLPKSERKFEKLFYSEKQKFSED